MRPLATRDGPAALMDNDKEHRMLRPLSWKWAIGAVVILAAGTAQAADTAQALLDKATDAKLGAESLADLNQVIQLSREAIEAGLDDANKKFATELLASTLSQRAEMVCLELFEHPVSPNRAQKLLQMALADLEETIRLNADQPEAQFLLGRLNAHLGKTEEARKALDEAVRLSGNDPAAKSKALVIRANLHEDPAARQADYDEAARLTPQDPEVLRFRGMHYLTQNNVEAALADLNAAIEKDPKDAGTHEARGMALAVAARLDEAMESFNKAIELEPNSPTALTHRARVRAMKGDLPAAITDVEQAMKLRPGSVQAIMLHASLLGATGKYEQALAELNVVRQVMPDNPDVNLQIAAMYQATKQNAKAIVIFDEVLAKEPANVAALRGKGDTCLNLGKQAEAVAS
jgi:tetratricopeptide (TPR) repeat protein